jgi:Rrf2 family transcriptional regulator, cysteine metabolism repressor
MTLLSRKADYALLILSHLHHATDGGNARAIAGRFKLSQPFVANILKELCQKGFVTSTRGVKGGYALAKPSSGVTLAQLLEAIEDGFRLTVCADHPASAPACDLSAVCPVKGPMNEIHRRLMGVLRGVTLAELFSPTAEPSQLQTLGILPAPEPATKA